MPASFLRRCLALYLDYCFFVSLWDAFGPDGGAGRLAFLIAFVVLRSALRYSIGTPGRFLLSIDRDGVVDPEIKEGESWITILVGVLFVTSGAGTLFAGFVLPVPVPQFGLQLDPSLGAALCAGWGAFNIFTAYLLFKLNRGGFWLGLTSSILALASFAMNGHLMPAFLRDVILAEHGDIDPRIVESTVAMLAQGGLVAAIVATLLTATGLGFSYPRLTRTA
jgi:hypothetical protein